MKQLHQLPQFQEKKINQRIMALEKNLAAFSQITSIPITYYSVSGNSQWSTTPQNQKICSTNREYGLEEFICTKMMMSAMRIALSLPDGYMFMCNSGFLNICYALYMNHVHCGFLIAGPIAMGNSIEKVFDSFFTKISSQSIDYGKMMTLIKEIKLYSPRETTYLTTMLQNAIAAACDAPIEQDTRSQNYDEQSEISQKLIDMKKENLDIDYPYQAEKALTHIVKSGDTKLCKRYLSKYIEDVMVFEAGNLSLTKLRLITFITQLLKDDEEWQKNHEFFFLLEKINDAQTLREMITTGGKLVHALAESASNKTYAGTSSIIKDALAYVHLHYMENLTLQDTAEQIHVNRSYLSTLFKQEVGVPFAEYLCHIRLQHAEDCLIKTVHPITEICLSTGFSSPSYFTKLFKEKHGITPREFRKQHQ